MSTRETMNSAQLLVVGSANHDRIQRVVRLPKPGETVIALDTVDALGGKGLCQALAARSFGAATSLIATVGEDEWGQIIRTTLREFGVNSEHVTSSALGTGQAYVMVDRSGENVIVVERGANAESSPLSAGAKQAVAHSSVLLTQTEGGIEAASEAIRDARAAGATTLLNAAPAHPISDELLQDLDYLLVNEIEVCQLANLDDYAAAAAELAAKCGAVVVTLGERGGELYRAGLETVRVAALPVDVVDTTGAGDNFCGVFAAALSLGHTAEEALRFGVVAGSLSTRKVACVPSIPSREEITANSSDPLTTDSSPNMRLVSHQV